MKRSFALLFVLAFSTAAQGSTAYGTLNNFDVVNDTGQTCHGFEIEIEDMHSADVTYTYDYNHYGTPKIREDSSDPVHPKVLIRYESGKDASGGFTAFTAVPGVPLAPTDGHQCTDPTVNQGCEHFGVGYYGTPTTVRYFWLVDDGAGNLARGPSVNVATPTWVYYPPVAGQPAQVQAVIAAPAPPEVAVKEFGPATWVKSIKTTTHSNRRVELRDLVSDDPDDDHDTNWRNGEPDEVEIEWQIMQEEFASPGAGNGELAGANEDLPNGDEVVTRRYEFFEYAGPYDPESNEALCDNYPDPTPDKAECDVELLGAYIGAQMAGFNVESPLGLIDHLQEGVENEPYPDRRVVVGGNTPYVVSIAAGRLPDGLSLNPTTGVLTGIPSAPGRATFTVHALDADSVVVSRDYDLTIAAAAVAVVAGDADADGDIDLNDLAFMRTRFGQPLAGPDDPSDVNRDGRINVLDYRLAITLCTRLRCVTE